MLRVLALAGVLALGAGSLSLARVPETGEVCLFGVSCADAHSNDTTTPAAHVSFELGDGNSDACRLADTRTSFSTFAGTQGSIQVLDSTDTHQAVAVCNSGESDSTIGMVFSGEDGRDHSSPQIRNNCGIAYNVRKVRFRLTETEATDSARVFWCIRN